MKVKIVGKELKVTEAINDYVEKKLGRIEKYFDTCDAEVTIRTEKNTQIAEMYLYGNGNTYRAVTESNDLYASIDNDIDILEGQIRKVKTKKDKMIKENSIKNMEIDGVRMHPVEDEILKIAYYEIKPMTPEDAKLKLQERPTDNFLAFINVDTQKTNVIFRLKDGKNYGLLEPEA